MRSHAKETQLRGKTFWSVLMTLIEDMSYYWVTLWWVFFSYVSNLEYSDGCLSPIHPRPKMKPSSECPASLLSAFRPIDNNQTGALMLQQDRHPVRLLWSHWTILSMMTQQCKRPVRRHFDKPLSQITGFHLYIGKMIEQRYIMTVTKERCGLGVTVSYSSTARHHTPLGIGTVLRPLEASPNNYHGQCSS